MIPWLQNLGHHLAEKHVAYYPISSAPVLSTEQNHETATGLDYWLWSPCYFIYKAKLQWMKLVVYSNEQAYIFNGSFCLIRISPSGVVIFAAQKKASKRT
jgi:hypothetical protein